MEDDWIALRCIRNGQIVCQNQNKQLESLPKNFNKGKYKLVNTGYKASAVPGTVAGLLEAHKQFGKLSLEEILKPVIKQAKEGVEVTYDLHKAIDSTPRLKSDEESRNKAIEFIHAYLIHFWDINIL